MRRLKWCVAAAALAGGLCLGQTRPAETPKVGPDISAAAARAIQELGDNSYAVREAAEKRLLEMGAGALPALQEALKSGDAEVAARAQKLIAELKVAVTPDTPAEVAAILREYNTANLERQKLLIEALDQLEERAFGNLLTLADLETNPQLRQQATAALDRRSHQVARWLLSRGETERAETFMRAGYQRGIVAAGRDWNAYVVMKGRYVPERDRLLKEMVAAATVDRQRELQARLSELHRAAGKLDLALTAARESWRSHLIFNTLVARGDWAGLLEWDGDPELPRLWQYQRTAAFALAAYYLGAEGDEGVLSKNLRLTEDLRSAAQSEEKDGRRANLNGRYGQTLNFLNQADEAAEAMVKGNFWSGAVMSLAARGKFVEAVALCERARREGANDLAIVKVKQALLLNDMGESKRARDVLDEISAEMVVELDRLKAADAPLNPSKPPPALRLNGVIQEITGARRLMKQMDAGVSLELRLLEQVPLRYPRQQPTVSLSGLYGARWSEAQSYAVMLHEIHPEDPLEKTLETAGDIVAGRIRGTQLENIGKLIFERAKAKAEAIKDSGGDTPAVTVEELQAEWWAWRLRQDLAAGGVRGEFLEALAQERVPVELQQANARLLRVQGRLACRLRDWGRMAAAYEELSLQPDSDWASYLAGYALVRAGAGAPGESLKRRAEWSMLGSVSQRLELGSEAIDAGIPEVGREHLECVLRLAEPSDLEWVNASQMLALSGTLPAVASERLMESFGVSYMVSEGSVTGGRFDGDLLLVRKQHELAARAAVERKDWPRVAAELETSLKLYPGHGDVVMELVPAIDAAGHNADADRLVAQLRKHYGAELAAFPKSARSHNNLAWLCGRTGRDLDVGLEHAQAATRLAPTSAAYLDTLAEVRFARGEFAEAVAVEKQALDLTPNAAALKASLARFEAAAGK